MSAIDQLINFTDGVTAVAITVLVSLLVDLCAQASEKTVGSTISDNSGRSSLLQWFAHGEHSVAVTFYYPGS